MVQKKKRVEKILVILLILFLILCLLWALNKLGHRDDFGGVMFNAKKLTTEQRLEAKKQIEFPGFSDTALTMGGQEHMYFQNPKENEVTFEYVVAYSDSGEVLYTTERMAPGSALNINMAKLLGIGRHNLQIKVNTYSIKDGKPRNNMEFNLVITVKK